VADAAGFIVAVNYNGAPSGQPHCIDSPCKAISLPAPQSHLACRAVHGEANALLTAGPRAKGGAMACTTSPCYECAKLIVAAGIKVLVMGEVNRLFDDEVVYSQTPRQLLITAGVFFTTIESQP
jgi:deoxycytidylate deaminase